MVVLFLLGVVGLIELGSIQVGKMVHENLSFNLLLDSKLSADETNKLLKQVQESEFVKQAKLISADEALKELSEELRIEDPSLVLGYNPLQPEILVNLHARYAHPDSLAAIDKTIRSWNGVDSLEYRSELLREVHDNSRLLGIVLLAVAAVLLLISYIQINNTTRLLIYSKRFLIHNMTLIGATAAFIRRPFVGYSVANGLIAALMAIALLAGGLWALDYYSFSGSVFDFFQFEYLLMLAGVLLLMGLLISAISAWAATNKYIRMDGSKMHLI